MSSEDGVPSEERARFTFWRFQIGQAITLNTPPSLQGTIIGRADYGVYQMYQVAYWYNGERYLEWFTPLEIA